MGNIMSINDAAKAIPGLPNEIQLPDVDSKYTNLANDPGFFSQMIETAKNVRRVRDDPSMLILAACDDSGLEISIKNGALEALNKIKKWHDQSLPRFLGDDPTKPNQEHLIENLNFDLWHNRQEIVKHSLTPSHVEHAFLDYRLAYAELFNDAQLKALVNQFAKYLIYATMHENGGYKEAHGKFYSRNFIRWLWLLISHSESGVIEPATREKLSQLATDLLTWFVGQKANGKLDKIGYASYRHMCHEDLDVSQNLGHRANHCNFHQFRNEIAVKIINTTFFQNNRAACSVMIKGMLETNNTMFARTRSDVTNFSVKDFFLDNENHIYNRLGYPPRQFWLSVKNKGDFNGLIKNMAVEWFPFVQFHLPAIVVWTAIENNSADRVQAPVKKKTER
jgi:hypothetical protein